MNYKKEKTILIICILLFFLISSISIYSANSSYLSKQVIWYIIGFLLIICMPKKIINKVINNYPIIIYIALNILLIFLLLFGKKINGSKCWIIIPKIGSFEPSEFMKIAIIILNAKILSINKKSDSKLFFKILLITFIPCLLTFLQPDTGMVLIYLLISFIMLFASGFKKSIFIILFITASIFLGSFLLFYFKYQDQFINIFGTSFFYRIDRLLDWSNKSGIQLENALASIKAAGMTGFGINKMPIYIPEAHTDFIFSIYSSITGFIGTILLIIIILLFDFTLFNISFKTENKFYKFIIIGFLSMIIYQQVQNIGMNIGLLPITGITLPFISYGGSSLLSYMFTISIIIKFNENKKTYQSKFN